MKLPGSGYCLAVFLLIAALPVCSGTQRAFGAGSVSQFGITWTFDKDYPTGRFANGDYWVVGPVTIIDIHPRSKTRDGVTMHGSMINPTVNAPHGYDSRIRKNVYDPKANVGLCLPLLLPPGTSLLSAESYTRTATGHNPQLKTIAILTILERPAPDGSFRPPYIGGDKTLRWNASELNFQKLRTLKPVAHTPRLSIVDSYFERPWIEQKTNWSGRYLHPAKNQPAYGRDMARCLSDGLLLLQLRYPIETKRRLLIRIVQYGIDIYGAAREGAVWGNDGGHNHGRKMPLLLAGTVLGDPAILEYADARKHLIFQEDQQTWYVAQADVARPLRASDGKRREKYAQSDVGRAEWGIKHATDPRYDGSNWSIGYRTIVGSSIAGHVLTARLMGLEEQWNWPALFDYADRYWRLEKDSSTKGPNAVSPFVHAMWSAYRDSP